MPSSTLITDYMGRGTHAARPSSPNVPSGSTAVYYETDTGVTYVWTGSTWINALSSVVDTVAYTYAGGF